MSCGCLIITTSVGVISEMLQFNSNSPCSVCVEPTKCGTVKSAIEEPLSGKDKAQAYGVEANMRVQRGSAILVIWFKMAEVWNAVKIIG